MRAQIIGRFLGIGVRVAGRVASQHMPTSGHSTPAVQQQPQPIDAAARGRAAAHTAQRVGRAAQQGAGGFFRSFRRAGSIVWLQVTGVFFFLPVIAFAPTLWRTRMSYAHGPDHRTFVVTAIMVVVFLYLGLTSFWRAGRK